MTIDAYLKQMTLEEKCAMVQGWSTWTTRQIRHLNIPAAFLSDGPHGLRKQAGAGDHLGLNASVPATCFPTTATVANSWDTALGEAVGRALGREAAANDVHVLLGPGLNIKRSPLCGRNFEYFSEDPYLSGKMAAAYIRGIQENGVAACPKHFAANSQELRRMSMDAVVDERTLREIYLTGFEIAVTEGRAKTIMSSYNMVNGTYANENAHLLMNILRQEWGFEGFVVTDWGGDNDHAAGVRAGSALVMPAPGPNCARELCRAVREGKLAEWELDDRIREMLGVLLPAVEAVAQQPKTFDREAHHALARRCAAESIVLLENDGILPLKQQTEVAVIGEFAAQPRYQGAGSSLVNPTKLDTLLECLRESGLAVTGYARGFDRKEPKPDENLIREAVELAKNAPAVLLCVGLDEIMESEGMDRSHMNLSESQNVLMEAVCAVNPNVVLVLSGGSPFVIPRQLSYRAAVHGYLGGQAGAGAMADVLTGKVNPSGKLNETWPLQLEDNPSYPWFPSRQRTSEYREGLFVGYRYYDTAGVAVRYPFGHGMSYTRFAYSGLEADRDQVSLTVTNCGDTEGAEVVQIYVSCPESRVYRPRKELKGFAKVFLKPGESRRITIPLDAMAFRYFNTAHDRWETETGTYEIHAAASLADVRLTVQLQIRGDAPWEDGLECYHACRIQDVSDEAFAKLLGRPIPDGSWQGALQENDAICQMYYAKSRAARLVCRLLNHLKEKAEASGKPDLNILFITNMPFRAIAKMTGGMVSSQMVADILTIVNGQFFAGLGRLTLDFFRNRSENHRFIKALESLEVEHESV